jgi:hypothetical protein
MSASAPTASAAGVQALLYLKKLVARADVSCFATEPDHMRSHRQSRALSIAQVMDAMP